MENDKYLNKLKSYCAYQERSLKEVCIKIDSLGIRSNEVDGIILLLQKENFLNEERFVHAFVRGKFKMKLWGRIRIKNELRFHEIAANLINVALEQIDESEYLQTLEKLFLKKKAEFKGAYTRSNQQKMIHYLSAKGYEYELIMPFVETQD